MKPNFVQFHDEEDEDIEKMIFQSEGFGLEKVKNLREVSSSSSVSKEAEGLGSGNKLSPINRPSKPPMYHSTNIFSGAARFKPDEDVISNTVLFSLLIILVVIWVLQFILGVA
mmetsp:Transcript_6997/g.6180  ORF Transcript_6997/g.6180 Transcript_6997/m.6180 type:complete len:113 (+) Transcript_6997:14-352(+)